MSKVLKFKGMEFIERPDGFIDWDTTRRYLAPHNTIRKTINHLKYWKIPYEVFEIKDEEPVPNPTLIIARDGTIHRKVKGKKAKPVHTGKNIQHIPHTIDCLKTGNDPDCLACAAIRQREIPSSVARVIMENPEGGKPVIGVLRSYYCEKCKRRHFSGTRTFETHFEHAGLTL